jgi:Cft2 family RNA processing exonuclease
MVTFLPLGGAGEIGASSFYLNIAGTGILLDCGLHPQKSGLDALPRFDLIDNLPLDYAIISHSHQDHIASLPFLIARFPHVKIISTPETRAIAELTLHNSVSIIKQQINDEEMPEIYSHEEIDLLIKTIRYHSCNHPFYIDGHKHRSRTPIKVTFYDAGHILGSACILLEHEDKKIFYTGDLNFETQQIMLPADFKGIKPNLLIMETTYGSTESETINKWSIEAARLAKEINKVFSAGGSVLIPVFALGKLQEILTSLWLLMQKGKLTPVDIYTGGLGNKISRIYDYSRFNVRVKDPDFQISSIPVRNIYDVSNPDDFFKEPSIILAASGMMIEGTASFNLAKHWFRRSNSAIFTVGYMDESTPGYKVANAKQGDKLAFNPNEEPQEVKCLIKQFRFPAHATRESLVNMAGKMNSEHIVLVHGEPSSLAWIGKNILDLKQNQKVYAAEIGKEITFFRD